MQELAAALGHADDAAAFAAQPALATVDARVRAKALEADATARAAKDVEAYHAALERALLAFHSSKMAVVNAALRELWQKTYRGGDVDHIGVRADADAKSARSYNYRLVMVAGGAAGTSFWLAVFPADVIKSRWQVDTPGPGAQFRGVWDCARQTFASGGVRALYRGFGPCMVRAFPANATCFCVYETCVPLLTEGMG
jgi:hypothetical protein